MHSPPSMLAITAVARTTPRCLMAINELDQRTLNKRASQQDGAPASGNEQEVSVWLETKRVAIHNRCWGVGQEVKDDSHAHTSRACSRPSPALPLARCPRNFRASAAWPPSTSRSSLPTAAPCAQRCLQVILNGLTTRRGKEKSQRPLLRNLATQTWASRSWVRTAWFHRWRTDAGRPDSLPPLRGVR